MKAIIEINFRKVAGKEVTNEPNVRTSIKRAVKKLCESTKKFYADYKIEVEVSSRLENE